LNLRGKRKFICKRCGKQSSDEQGGFERFDKKLDIKIVYENVDLCKKCFNRSVKDYNQLRFVESLSQKGILKTEEDFLKFQSDKKFRTKLIRENFENKAGELKKRNALIKAELLKSQVNKI